MDPRLLHKLIIVVVFICQYVRFPRNKPINNTISKRYGDQVLRMFRTLERTSIRLTKAKCHLQFLNTCKLYNLTPKFLRFKLYDKRLHRTDHYKAYQRKLLEETIKAQNHKTRKLERLNRDSIASLKSNLDWIDFHILNHKIRTRCRITENGCKETHARKLRQIGLDDNQKLDPTKVVINLSSVTLTREQIETLALGLEYALPPTKIQREKHLLSFEKLAQMLKSQSLRRGDKSFQDVCRSIAHLANETYYDFKNWKHLLPDNKTRSILKDLIDNPEIVITKPDKGRAVVILNKAVYVDKTLEIIDDETKFRKVRKDPLKLMLSLQTKINDYLYGLYTSSKISLDVYTSLRISSAKPGILYGLPKIHKPTLPIRPIMSAIGTFNYNLSKFIVPVISPIAENAHTIRSTQEFARDIREISLDGPIYMTSFDITSLYTNVPTKETVNIILDSLCDKDENFCNLTRTELRQMLELTTKNNVFYFNNQLYEQIDGLPMGGPASCVYANAFLCHHEHQWLLDCPKEFAPVLYKRYLDDCFVVFRDKEHADLFDSYINNKHPHIKFTKEVEENNSLNFLDLTLTHANGRISTQTYRKPTHTGQGTNYSSFIDHLFKINAIKTLLHRAYSTCSSWIEFDKEVKYLISYFTMNKYPNGIIMKEINRFLNRMLDPGPSMCSVQKRKLYVKFQYLGPLSFHLRKNLRKLLNTCYPQIDFRFVFVNGNTIKNLFPYKDRIPDLLQSNVIYQYDCVRCNSDVSYIGQTTCNLAKRIAEHEGISERTGAKRGSPPASKIREHCQEKHKSPPDKSGFKIIARAMNSHELGLIEAIYITLHKPTLNKQLIHETLLTL